ncbi:MAG: hypothetical protein J6J83_06045 [Oscillospiraceae bacterium]|nr:hypothetical protein [Oscillospiraceae bacterium]
MKLMEKLSAAIVTLVALCLLCAVAAFFLPTVHGTILSCLAIALGTVVAVLCIVGMVSLHSHSGAAA